MQLDPVRLAAALQELGVTPAALQAVRAAPPDRARMMLDELKKIAKHRYRALAKLLHPDQNGGDPSKTEKFSFLSEVMRQIDSMEYRPLPPAPPAPPMRPAPARPAPPVPQPQVIRRVVFRAVPAVSVFNQTRTSAGGPTPGAPRGVHVVFMRPT